MGRVIQGTFALFCVLTLVGCGPAEPGSTALPTFPAPVQQTGPSATVDDGRVIPADCGRILSADALGAVMGMPLGSVALRTTIGVAEPSVGRTERVTCRYNRTGDSAATVLDINITNYRDPAAADKQWATNAGVESGQRRDLALGSAKAAFFEKPDEAVLMVAYSTGNLTLILPNQPLPGGRNRGDMLVDLALRVLPPVTSEAPSVPPQPPQAGAAR